MREVVSPSTGKPYSLARLCRVLEVARSSVYAVRSRSAASRTARKRGPKTEWSDEVLLERIREVLRESPFHGEGHRKIWARLRLKGVRSSKVRVLRLLREAGLLVPAREGRAHGPAAHDGTIITQRPDEMWGIDATATVTTEEGTAAIFIAVEHATAECVGIHAARAATRFEALEPIRQGLREHFHDYGPDVARGLALRHDHGSAFTSELFQTELRFLGIRSSPAFVREPEGNGCAERFIRTLKEQLLWVRTFRTLEELRLALLDFKVRYNTQWILARHGYLTPNQARAKLLSKSEVAA